MDETGIKAVVTGAAGFIGSHLTDRLLQEGNEVLGYDNFDPYYSNKDRNLLDAAKNPKFCLIKGDILDNEGLANAFKDSHLVFHEAAQPGVRYSIEYPLKVFRANLQVTINVLEAARLSDSPKLIFASTSAVYGNAIKFPVSEKMELKPISPYGLSKLLAEKICLQYSELYGLKVVILRYHNVYGPRQRPDNAIRKWITSLMLDKPILIYGDGFQKRDFTYIDSIVDGTLKAASEKKAEGEIINLGSGAAVTVNETVSLLKKILNKPSIKLIHEARKLGDVNDTFADISKARSTLGYNPTTSLEEGLRNQVQWCTQYG
jgi:nucleoside-diphosphate-sugar epimerase